jgi:hypothetical protein
MPASPSSVPALPGGPIPPAGADLPVPQAFAATAFDSATSVSGGGAERASLSARANPP